MVDKKGTGWIPDYPDVRDYQIGEINQRLKIKAQDIQITTDIQTIFEKIVNALDNLKNPNSLTPEEIDELSTSMSGNLKFIKTKVLKEEFFLSYGSLGYEVYDLQLKLLKLYEYINYLEQPKDKDIFDDFIDSLENLKLAFEIDKSSYIEHGYFGEFTQAAVKYFKEIYQKPSNTNDNIDNIVDCITIFKLNEILEKLAANNYDATKNLISTKVTKAILPGDNQSTNPPDLSITENNNSKNVPNSTLTFGIKNEKVTELQSSLKELEEFDGPISGYFGSLTQAAVINFQKKHQLIVDGIVGEQTWGLLHYLVKRKNQQQYQRLVLTYSSPIPAQLYEIILNLFELSELRRNFKDFYDFKTETFINLNLWNLEINNEQIDDLKKDRDEQELKRSINMLVKLIAQLISPLSQHISLEQTVKDVFSKLDKRFEKSGLVEKIPNEQEKMEKNLMSVMENYGIFPKKEQKKDFLKDWDINPLSLPLALSIILNLKKALKKIKDKKQQQNITEENEIITNIISKSINKINEVFKSIEDSEKVNLKIHKNIPGNQYNNFKTTIEILKDAKGIPSTLEKNQEIQGDLQLPIARNLHKTIIGKQGSVYLLMPDFVDLSFWCSPIEDQGSLDSCTAFAGIALIEYFQKKSFDRHIDASPLFLYKVTRNLMHRQGDAGASLRETMKAMALFGVPPEEYWPYEEDKFDREPSPFCYSFAQNYQALKYFRLNPTGTSNDLLLVRVKTGLATGIPCAFGFTLYYSIDDNSNPKGHIPYPLEQDKVKGGHAAVAVGYDDHKLIENADGKQSKGALLIRNSWGRNWGEGGYGWLPYDYVLQGLTDDWWSLLKSEWFETGKFGLGANNWASNLGGARTPNQPKNSSR
ncbi:hypothetical protein FACHB389_35250 [Nostoc calcicola FACHB-389]|nr:peptidoglycan-binding protein [Nostoc calcicola FACHB-3891]OKH16886.1 hypothetical protein FACHB389_35250 [Nostoc calcicola FACHB-389]